MKVGDQVHIGGGKPGIVREIEWHGVTIHWPQAFGWASGHTVWYTHNEIQKYGIKEVSHEHSR